MVEKDLKFPEKGSTSLKVKLEIKKVLKEVKNWKMEEKLGGLHSEPHPISLSVWKKFLKFNPNNLGNWSLASQKNLDGTQLIERKLIKMLIDLFGGKQSQWEGYVTSGATEANIFSAWVGRILLEKLYERSKICLISNSLSHYSIIKSSDVVGIDNIPTAIDRKSWSMDLVDLKANVTRLSKKGYKGFIIPLTVGYAQTGTSDDYQKLIGMLRKLEYDLRINTFNWVDAALSGLVLPFTTSLFLPLKNTRIQTFCVDFHKAGMVPIPCGVILHRRSLRKNVERSIPYIHEDDNTLLGSRSGISPVVAYAIIRLLGKNGLREVARKGQREKRKFKNLMAKKFANIEVTGDEDGISIGLVSKSPISLEFREKFGLYARKFDYHFSTGTEKLYIYKASFLFRP